MSAASTRRRDAGQALVPGDRKMRADAVATRARIVATAETLFAQHGLEGVSLVEIGRAANQKNRSAVQYHFGDKRGLVMAIREKHTPGIEIRRQAMLDDIDARGHVDLRSLVEALVWPVADKLLDRDGGIAYLRMNAELVGHARHPLLSLDSEHPNVAAVRLRRLAAKVTPRLPEAVRVPRWLMITGMLFHGLADWSRHRPRKRPPREIFVHHLVDGITAVLEAPVSSASKAVLRKSQRRK